MSTRDPPHTRRHFMLTIWQQPNPPPGDAGLRIRLEDPRSGEHWGSTRLEDLIETLKKILKTTENQNE